MAEQSVLAASAWTRRGLDALSATVPTADDRESVAVRAPATGEQIGAVPACRPPDVAAAVERARDTGEAWCDRSVDERAAVLRRFGRAVLEDRERLLDLLQLETGKARRDALEEVLDVATTASYYAAAGPDVLADETRRGAVPGATTARVRHEPVGTVGAISPWNYPLTLSVSDALPALLAGCPVICKPDAKTPFVALALAEYLREAGLPADAFRVVTGEGGIVGPALVESVDYVAFTGSTETGRDVAARAGRHLVDCSLELGGLNPMLVLRGADVETAARGAVRACFSNAGQLCLSVERIYVHEDRYEAFLDAFVGATRDLSLGTGLDYGADVGSLIGADQRARVESHLADAVERGASVLTGGRHRADVAPHAFEPTVLTDLPAGATAADEETFGPVVAVHRVADADAAVAAANDSEYGLHASVWAGDRERGRAVARGVDCGTVCVNDAYVAAWSALDAPMGGTGNSGIGRRHGPEGLRRYLDPRTVAVSRVGPLDAPRWLPDGLFRRGAVGAARLQQALDRWFR
ncbi:MAG: succinic semialdehyde dehydrogenase [Haloarculaceae archaeon]